MIVTIDPGHGGSDTGAAGVDPRSGRKVFEKDLNLLLAFALREQLESRCRAVFLTRDGDHNLGLLERVRVADRSRGRAPTPSLVVALISIHHNGAASAKARGFELLIDKITPSDSPNPAREHDGPQALDPSCSSDDSHADGSRLCLGSTSTQQRTDDRRYNPDGLDRKQLQLAETILPGVAPVLERWGIPLRNPPIKNDADDSARGHLTLLEEATVPAVIIETCFVTNPLELLAATSTAFQVQFAEALAEALTAWAEDLGID